METANGGCSHRFRATLGTSLDIHRLLIQQNQLHEAALERPGATPWRPSRDVQHRTPTRADKNPF